MDACSSMAVDAGQRPVSRTVLPESKASRPKDETMPRKVLVINGHPDGDPKRLCAALADAYAEGARGGGHEVATLALAELDVPYLRNQSEFEKGAVPDSLKAAAEAVMRAEHVVFVFPLWLGTMPALLKAFLEQVLRPGVAFEYGEKGPKTLLSGRSARMVVTMGMPAFVYRLYFLSHGVAGLRRSILRFVGFKPVRTTLIGLVTMGSDDKRRKWLARVREFGRRAV
jgi:putative NADPH-quinone reductase